MSAGAERRTSRPGGRRATSRPGGHTLVARLDNAGDVLLTGPAVRAVAAGSDRVTILCGPAGEPAARLLPGVDEVVTWRAPWVGFEPHPVDGDDVAALVDRLRSLSIDRAALCTSFHQSPLPLALLLRLAGVGSIAAVSEDFPGTLVDHRQRLRADLHEVEQNLALVAALGFEPESGDDGRLRVGPLEPPPEPLPLPLDPYVVLHPGASVPARALPTALTEPLIDNLLAAGWVVVVSGGGDEPRPRPRKGVVDLVGRTTFASLGVVLAGAAALVCGNTGPAHLAAAVGTPVVSVFAPVVRWARWRPWGVPSVALGDQDIACAGCRARTCPFPGQPCLAPVTPPAVVRAVAELAGPGTSLRARTPAPDADRPAPLVAASPAVPAAASPAVPAAAAPAVVRAVAELAGPGTSLRARTPAPDADRPAPLVAASPAVPAAPAAVPGSAPGAVPAAVPAGRP